MDPEGKNTAGTVCQKGKASANADFALWRGLTGIGGQDNSHQRGSRDQRIVGFPGAVHPLTAVRL